PTLHEYRKAAEAPPSGAPEPRTADAGWKLLQRSAAGRERPLDLAALCTPLMRQLSQAEREGAEMTTRQAVIVAVDVAIGAGRDRRLLYSNALFEALAERWSPAFRDARPASKSYDMLEETVRRAKRDLIERGINRKALWRLIRDGVPGLFTTRLVGG